MKIMSGWDNWKNLLEYEFVQKEYEGFIVPERARTLFEMLSPRDATNEEKISEIYSLLENAEKNPDFKYVQPYHLDDIVKARPAFEIDLPPLNLSEEALIGKLHGAWTGRSVGCALGKPVEGMGMTAVDGKNGRRRIKDYLLETDDWPLDDYFRKSDKIGCHASCRENIAYMEPDDDIHYTLIALKVIENHDRDFTWHDIANTWNSSLPYNAICTAETQAILNYNFMTPRMGAYDKTNEYCTAAFTSLNNNPYREWIGAQIRADGWGYACPGNPVLAAEYAWRDGHWTHRANGIYGEMFIAAVTAAAFVCDDWMTLMKTGLAVIPEKSRLAEDLNWMIDTIQKYDDFESFMTASESYFKDMSPVHTNNNCVICAMSLYYGKNDPEKTAAIAVMAGLDTDCNGATAGSIAGIISGIAGFGKLAAKLNDTIKPLVFGFQEVTMHELAVRTFRIISKN